MHPCDITERPSHRRDLEGFYDHCCWRSHPSREDAGICPWHFLGPAGWHCHALPTSGWVIHNDWLDNIVNHCQLIWTNSWVVSLGIHLNPVRTNIKKSAFSHYWLNLCQKDKLWLKRWMVRQHTPLCFRLNADYQNFWCPSSSSDKLVQTDNMTFNVKLFLIRTIYLHWNLKMFGLVMVSSNRSTWLSCIIIRRNASFDKKWNGNMAIQ